MPDDEVTWPCCPELGLGGRREECWDDRPVGLLGGTDKSVCWWWSLGWKASPGKPKTLINVTDHNLLFIYIRHQFVFWFITLTFCHRTCQEAAYRITEVKYKHQHADFV